MPAEHPPAFRILRDAIVADLDDGDRRRLAAFVGCKNDPQAPLSADVVRVLAAIVALDDVDRRRLARWCAAYLSRWGQVPCAASYRVKAAARLPPPGA